MEGGGWSWEQRALVNELIQGMEVARVLSFHLKGTPSVENAESLVQRILSSYEKALLILNWSGPVGQQPPQAAAATATVGTAATGSGSGSGIPESPLSRNGSPRSEDFDGIKDNQAHIDVSKKRGTHSCSFGHQQTVVAPPPASPEKQEQIKHNFSSSNQQQPPPGEALLNLQKGLKVDTQDLAKRETVPFTFPSTYECQNSNFSQSFLSPATPEPNYNHVSPFVNSFGGTRTFQHSDSDLAEILSAQTSATSSPMLDLDFHLESFELVPNFSYAPGFFS